MNERTIISGTDLLTINMLMVEVVEPTWAFIATFSLVTRSPKQIWTLIKIHSMKEDLNFLKKIIRYNNVFLKHV